MRAFIWKMALATLIGVCLEGAAFAEAPVPEGKKPACCSKEQIPPGDYSDSSLYQLDSTWTDQTAAPRKLSFFRGKPVVITMFFAQCHYACPILVHDMKRIEAALRENGKTNVGFVLVSFDSERDTPGVLAAYHRTHGLDSKWTSLHGKPDDVLELAALLGIKFKKDARGQFAHSNLITVLNPQGEIVHQQIGLNQDVAETVKKIEESFGR